MLGAMANSPESFYRKSKNSGNSRNIIIFNKKTVTAT